MGYTISTPAPVGPFCFELVLSNREVELSLCASVCCVRRRPQRTGGRAEGHAGRAGRHLLHQRLRPDGHHADLPAAAQGRPAAQGRVQRPSCIPCVGSGILFISIQSNDDGMDRQINLLTTE